MAKLLLNKYLISALLLFSINANAELLGHTKESVKSITIPVSGLVLTSDTILRANVINLNGKIETNGHKLFIDTQYLSVGDKGKIIGFSSPAEAQVLIPESITYVPAKAGRSGNHGATGVQGQKGIKGFEGINGKQDSRSITVYAKQIDGHLLIDGSGEQGGEGGRGGQGGRGSDGGDGRKGHVDIDWKGRCINERNGGNAGGGGAPGLGGDGGKGGLGGNNIEVIFRSDDISNDKVSIISKIGEGGFGGAPGEYGLPGQAGGPGEGASKDFRVVAKLKTCRVSAGSARSSGLINESESQRLARTGARGEQGQQEVKKIDKQSAKELTNLKESLEKNLIKFHLRRLLHTNKLELYSYLAGRVEFLYEDFDKELLESLNNADKEIVREFKGFLEKRLLSELDQKYTKSIKEFEIDIKEVISTLDLIENSSIESAHQNILNQLDRGVKKISSHVEKLIIECMDYRDVSKIYYGDLVPLFAKIPSCEVNGLTNLRHDFFAKLDINQSYRPSIFPNSVRDILTVGEIVGTSRTPAEVIINTIIINNKKLKVDHFKDALNINKNSFVVTSYEITKNKNLSFSDVITNFKVALAALEVLGE